MYQREGVFTINQHGFRFWDAIAADILVDFGYSECVLEARVSLYTSDTSLHEHSTVRVTPVSGHVVSQFVLMSNPGREYELPAFCAESEFEDAAFSDRTTLGTATAIMMTAVRLRAPMYR